MRIINTSKPYHLTVLVLTLLISLFCLWRLPQLQFNYDFEAFFPNQDNELEQYEQFRKRFEYDNEFILIAIENQSGIFNAPFLQKVNTLTSELASLENVTRVQSPTNLKVIKAGGLVPVSFPLLHFDEPLKYRNDSTQIYSSPFWVGSYFSEDAKSISLFVKTSDVLPKKKCDVLADQITALLDRYKFDNTHTVGRIFAQQVYLTNIQREFFWFISIAIFLVVLFLWITFRKAYSVVIPVVIVLTAILWTLGAMSLLSKSIDIMSIMLPTMIFVAGMSDVVHFFSRYFEERAKNTNEKKIFPIILKEVGIPTLLTLVTTAVGFLSLLFSSIQPVRDFGLYTSLGVTLAFILTYTLLPALLYFFHPKQHIKPSISEEKTQAFLARLMIWVLRRSKVIIVFTIVLCGLAIVGVYKIRVNNILLEDLSDKVKIKQDFKFLDANFSGVRPLELQLDFIGEQNSVWLYSNMLAVHRIDSFVQKEYKAGFLLSPAVIVKQVYSGLNEVSAGSFPTVESYDDIYPYLQQNKNNKELKRFISKDGKTIRISAKIRDIGSMAVREHNQKLLSYCETNLPENIKIQITGAAHLLDRNNEYMVTNMSQGFVFSLVVIALLTLVLHRSLKMVLVFLIPNLVPLLLIAGIMGYAGIELKAATSLVFSIAFGIATDDTIHFISRLKIELAYGKSILYALKRTYLETGKPIVLTTFILIGGFMSLMSSSFESTFYFGFLICITVTIALIADLFLLPALLIVVYGTKRKR